MKYQLIAAIFAVLLSATAHADWKDSYRAYSEALSRGDDAAALTHARNAWEQAREALPASENRALLAQNYASLAAFPEPQNAMAPLDDAIVMARAGFGLSGHEMAGLLFIRSEVAAAQARKDKKLLAAAVDAYQDVSAEGAVQSPLISQAYRLGQNLNSRGLHPELTDLGSRMSDVLFSFDNVAPELLLSAEALRAIGLLGDKPTISRVRQYRANQAINNSRFQAYADRLETSTRRFNELIGRFEPAKTLADVDPLAAQATAWRSLMGSFEGTFEVLPESADSDYVMNSIMEKPEACAQAIAWKNRDIQLPPSVRGINGAVLIGYHLNDEGRIIHTELLAEIPEKRFSRAAMEAMKSWNAEVDQTAPGHCLRDLTISFQFTTDLRM